MCRRLGITRWPYRKLLSVTNTLAEIDTLTGLKKEVREAWVCRLLALKRHIEEQPFDKSPPFTVRQFQSWKRHR
jgi:hypothetical protein